MAEISQEFGSFAPGTVVGGSYRVKKLISTGSMSDIYEAEHMRTLGRIALKVINPIKAADKEMLEMFRREAQLAASIGHEGIVHVFDVDQDSSGLWFIAMEFLEGETLKEYLKTKGILSLKETLWVADKVCDTMQFVHEKEIVHRDLKPANIFLARAGDRVQVKILDFGISKIMYSAPTRLSVGFVLGTPRYMSPEQACGSTELDLRTDIFSFGAVIYRMLAGAAPFDAPTVPETLDKLLTEDPPSLHGVNSSIPEQVEMAVQQALAKDPRARFESMGEFKEALLHDHPVERTARFGVGDTTSQLSADKWREMRRVTILGIAMEEDIEEADVSKHYYDKLLQQAAQIRRIVEEHGGMIEKTFRGSVMAVFGAPRSTGDDAMRGVRAALALKRTYANRDQILRMGISTGRVLAGRLVDEDGRYSVAGSAMHLARRLVGINDTGAVLIDQETYFQIRGRFRTRPVDGPARDKAALPREAGGQTYDVVEEHPYGLLLRPREVFGRHIKLVGRGPELEHLKALHRKTIEEGYAQSVLVIAPSGMGKSRFIYEIRACTEDLGVDQYTLFAEAGTNSAGIPFSLLCDMVKIKAQIQSDDGPDAIGKKIGDFVSIAKELRKEDRDFVQHIFNSLLTAGAHSKGGEDIGSLTEVAFRLFIEALLKATPVFIVMEDIQWADRKSLEIILHLAHQLKSTRLFILGTGTPDVYEQPESTAMLGLWQNIMKLPPLTRKESSELVTGILNFEASHPLVDRIVEISDGNPLFIVEFLQNLADRGFLVKSGGSWVFFSRSTNIELPGKVESIVQSRLDRLGREELSIVRMASLCGLTFWSEALVAMGARNVEKNLDALSSREFISTHPRSSVPGTREYSFRNYLVHKVCYTGLLRHERKEYHVKLARWLESTGSTSIDLRRLIAQNYLLAGEEEQAAMLYFDLGKACSAFRGEYTEAVDYFEQCLEIARSTGNRALQREALGQVGILSMKTGKFDKANEILQEAIRLAASDCLVEQEAEYTITLAGTLACLGDFNEALAASRHARKLCSGLSIPGLNMQLEKMTAFVYYFMEDIETATEYFIKAYDIAVESSNIYEVQLMMQNIGSCLFDSGKLDESRKYFEEANAICEKEEFWETRHLNNAYIQYLNLVQRSESGAMARLMEELDFARRTNNKWDLIQICILLGRAHYRVNRFDDAKRYLEEAIKEARKTSFTYYMKMAERALKEVGGA